VRAASSASSSRFCASRAATASISFWLGVPRSARQALGQLVDRRAFHAMALGQPEDLAGGLQLRAREQDFDVVQPAGRIRGIRLQRGRQVDGGGGQVVRLPFQQAELVMGLRMVRLHLEDGTADHGGLVQLAGLDVLHDQAHRFCGDALDFFVERYGRGL
jgi:hypothetical protein